MAKKSVPRDARVRACYQRALTLLRQTYDIEFQRMLSEEYEREGLVVKKRKSRMAAKRGTDNEE